MKTKYIFLRNKETAIAEYACGDCFAVIDEDDKYCWQCGAEILEEGASSRDELLEKRTE